MLYAKVYFKNYNFSSQSLQLFCQIRGLVKQAVGHCLVELLVQFGVLPSLLLQLNKTTCLFEKSHEEM